MDVKNWMSTFSDIKVTLRHVESGNVVTEMQFEGIGWLVMAPKYLHQLSKWYAVVEVEDG